LDQKFILSGLISFLIVLITTPLIIKLAIKINATDKPSERKVHTSAMPRIGGLAIFLGVLGGYIVGEIYHYQLKAISLGALLILIIGFIDDLFQLSAKTKLIFQIIVSAIVVSSGLTIELIYIPFIGKFDIGLYAFPLTILWIVIVTNIINLIDGLDGLASGTSLIIIFTIFSLAYINGNVIIFSISYILLGSILGFLLYNFHPARIFLGDSGSLLLGYFIAVLSLLGLYKSVTLFSFIVPLFLLGVPIYDTFFAVVRRILNKKPITSADKGHLHHQLLKVGLSHRDTVIFIYGMSSILSIIAISFPTISKKGALLIVIFTLFLMHLLAEFIGLVGDKHQPIIKLIKRFNKSINKSIKQKSPPK
jgi:UDP-GlcNAc:undecaprenyl-phosphate/decaprenyl-phosphate GlcNAc-1-phosphate transferase